MYTGSLQEVCGIQEASNKKQIKKNFLEDPNHIDDTVGWMGALAGIPAGPVGMAAGYGAGYLGSKGFRLINKKMDKELHRSR